MAKRHAAAALSVLMFSFAAPFALPAHAAGGTSDLLAAVQNVSSESQKFRSMMGDLNAGQIHLVNADGAMSGAAYQRAIHKNANDISGLQDTLNHTTVTGTDGVLVTLRKLMLQQNVTVDQVIGVYVDSSGQITLFYR